MIAIGMPGMGEWLVLIILFGLIVLPIIIILWRKALKRNND
jgi:hypothetical protein